MAGLGSGCFKFSNSVNNKKSYVYVKLTESAHKALEEYLKYRNSCKSQPAIAFNGNEGEIKIPNQNHAGSTFKFQMQKAQESDVPQGSFESIRQVDNHSLDSLGPLMSIMRIQAKDDSYEQTRQNMANAMAQNGKTCVKELKSNGVESRHRPTRPQRPVVPPQKKEPSNFTPSHFASNIYSSHNGNTTTSSLSPHAANAVSKPAWNPPPKLPHLNGRKVNEALKKRPLRERIIQLLAHKPMNKLQLMQKLHADGIKESDKRKIFSVVQGIATLKDNIYHLPKHMWSEVNENWPFFTEEEKQTVVRNNPLKLSPPERDLTPSSQSPISINSFSPSASDFSDSLKRRAESNFVPASKKPRMSNAGRFPDLNSRSESLSTSVVPMEVESRLSPGDNPEVRVSTRKSHYSQKSSQLNNQPRLQERRLDPPSATSQDYSLMNGHHSPSGASVSPLSQNNSPKSMSSSHNNNKSDAINHSLTNGLVSQVPEGRRNGMHKKDKMFVASSQYTNGIHKGGSPSPPSPDAQQENVDRISDYKLKYPRIEHIDQRKRYKTDFNDIYAKYQVLHSELEKTKILFRELEISLEAHQFGTPEYMKIKKVILNEYNKRQPNFQEKKQTYYHLDEVLKHIKQRVSEYDSVQRF